MTEDSFFKRVRRIEVVAAKLVDELLSGNYRSIFRGQGIEFDEVRDYTPGDDIRAIDWNVSARMGEPFTKIYREEREITLFFVVDVSASILTGSGDLQKNEYSALIFAILALSAVMNSDRVGAAFYSDEIERWVPPAKGRKHVLRLIHDLLSIQPESLGSNLGLALKTVDKNVKRRGICFIISDFKTEGYWDSLTLLGRRHDCIAIKITDPVDREFPIGGMVELLDPESGAVLLAEGRSASFRQAYADFWAEREKVWLKGCRLRGVETLTLSTSEDPGQALVRFFRKRRR